MSAVELKPVHDSLVELYMKKPEGHCFAFFDDVIVPACEKLARSSRHEGKLAGIIALRKLLSGGLHQLRQ